ncbi:hypothetical protein [Macrococcus animalis]|uniref:hypothetical protein n=1 Tax=Macrococcus animalis TaxID=3395467 RepID=UPI0039BE6ADF
MKFGNILFVFLALFFFGVQLFNVYDGIQQSDPKMIVSALYLISIGLFMTFNLYNAMLTQSGKVITPGKVKQQLYIAIALFILGIAILICIFIFNLGIVSKIVQFMLVVSIFFEIRTRFNQLNSKK